jgi:hypothetical protein
MVMESKALNVLREVAERLHGETGLFAGEYLDSLVDVESPSPCPKLSATSGRPGSLRPTPTRRRSGGRNSGVGTHAAGGKSEAAVLTAEG